MSNVVFQDEAEMAQRKIEEEFRELSKTLEDAKEKVRVINVIVTKHLKILCIDSNVKYSQGSNSEHSNSESIRKPNVSKFSF